MTPKLNLTHHGLIMPSAAILFLTTILAAAPTTRPREIAPGHRPEIATLGQAIDPTRPVFIPAFARVNNPPAGMAERAWANTYTFPTIGWGYGWGYDGFHRHGAFFTGHGYGTLPSHAFIR